MIFKVLILALAAFALYVRLAPSDPARWHRGATYEGIESRQGRGSYVWRQALSGDGSAQLAALDRVIRDSPRTRLLAGSVEEGQLSYVSRSRVWGFPDYTTIGIYDGAGGARYLEIYGRLRFGRSDLGVNAGRIRDWLRQIEAG